MDTQGYAGPFSLTAGSGIACSFVIAPSIYGTIATQRFNSTYGTTYTNTGTTDSDSGYICFNSIDVANTSGFIVETSINFLPASVPSQANIILAVIAWTVIPNQLYITSMYQIPSTALSNQTGVQSISVPSLYIQEGQYLSIWFANNGLSGSAARSNGRNQYWSATSNILYNVQNDIPLTFTSFGPAGNAVQFTVNTIVN
ncbi:unnamed protein product [Didymodactylos carnosus]|uniref:Uncharacterized protein n=1 Tax=Didymodactylos carnosus TaxID=1234261 RepID=A0A815N5B9_9BILA|nr:unnamed protein product [Didymodactylos carnosus]CAF1431948.1 unnamed protein product [Didymodactylos carnosus]CAF3499161.1 unnamed protein product [Didymodactylos carnosus]CAF4310440.1 unnamed protein product [Didymodactylos carnosus]